MALTGPRDSTVTVREPAGRLDAVVKRQAAQNPGICEQMHVLPVLLLMQTGKRTARTCMAEFSTCKMK